MVVDERMAFAQYAGDAASITRCLGGILTIEHPRSHVAIGEQAGRGNEEEMAGGYPIQPGGPSDHEHDRLGRQSSNSVEQQPAPSRRLLRGVDSALAGEQQAAEISAGCGHVSGREQEHAHQRQTGSLRLETEQTKESSL